VKRCRAAKRSRQHKIFHAGEPQGPANSVKNLFTVRPCPFEPNGPAEQPISGEIGVRLTARSISTPDTPARETGYWIGSQDQRGAKWP